MKRIKVLVLGVLLLTLATTANVMALNIHVINAGVATDSRVQAAIGNLLGLGHTVTTGGTLADYTGFDQVWDLRFTNTGALTAGDVTAMGNYLAQGGRMYLSGENSTSFTRNASLRDMVTGVGGGNLTLVNTAVYFGPQNITTQGQIVNSPNVLPSVNYTAALTVEASASTGFLVTQAVGQATSIGPLGSLVGWDFGDIASSPDARMLVGFDIDIFQNGPAWTENMVTYLGAEAPPTGPAPVPEPATVFTLGLGFIALAGYRRYRGSE